MEHRSPDSGASLGKSRGAAYRRILDVAALRNFRARRLPDRDNYTGAAAANGSEPLNCMYNLAGECVKLIKKRTTSRSLNIAASSSALL